MVFTHAHLAERVVTEAMRGDYAHNRSMGWMRWDSTVWKSIDRDMAGEVVRQWAKNNYDEAARAAIRAGDSDERKRAEELQRAWRGVCDARAIREITGLAGPLVNMAPGRFDNHPDLLNCPNGVVDLRTGHLQPHDRDLYLTKRCPTVFVPDADHPDWTKALKAIPEDDRDWFRDRMGQSITGNVPTDDATMILQGGGENGKTLVVGGINAAVGDDYAVTLSPKMLMGASLSDHETLFMPLRGARLGWLDETAEDGHLDTQRLKRISSGATITARGMRMDQMTFKATHAVVISTNHIPVVSTVDNGTWRRLILFRFPYTFAKGSADRDEGLRDRVLRSLDRHGEPDTQHQAILAWLVRGAVEWFRRGKVMPPMPVRVAQDTEQWRSRTDHVMSFWSDKLVAASGRHISGTDMLSAYNDHIGQGGGKAVSSRTFEGRFATHETTVANRVTYTDKAVRDKEGQSRYERSSGPFANPAESRYRRWEGVRFREPADDAVEGSHDAE